MDSSSKAPIALAASLLVLLSIHLALSTQSADPPPDDLLFKRQPGEELKRLTIRLPDGRIVQIDRREVPGGEPVYQIVRPFDKPAERLLVEGVVRMIFSLTRDDAVPVEALQLKDFGLDAPRLEFGMETHFRKIGLKFGRASPAARRGASFVYFMVEGDVRFIYQMFKPYYDDLEGDPERWRSQQVFAMSEAFVEGLVVEIRRPGLLETESVELRKVTVPGTGWRMSKPYDEAADFARVSELLSKLSGLRANRREAVTQERLVELGLDPPALRVAIRQAGYPAPTVVRLGRPWNEGGDDPKTRRTWIGVVVEGSDEIAVCDGAALQDAVPKSAQEMRRREFFPYALHQIQRMEIYCAGLGELILAAGPHEPGTKLSTYHQWTVLQPPGMQLDKGDKDFAAQMQAIESFVDYARRGTALEYRAREAAIEPAPGCRLRLTAVDGDKTATRVYHFSTDGGRADGMAEMGSGRYELFSVDPRYVENLRRMWLNFSKLPILNVPKGSIWEFKVRLEGEDPATVTRMPNGRWRTDRPGPKAVSEENAALLAERLPGLLPLAMMSMDPKDRARYHLDRPWAAVEVHYEDMGVSKRQTLKISPRIKRDTFYASVEGSDVIFKIPAEVAETLQGLHYLPE